MTSVLSGRQANVMDHAVAFPHFNRNFFYATVGSHNDQTWQELVAEELACHSTTQDKTTHTRYELTEKGMKAIRHFHTVSVEDELAPSKGII